MAEYLGHAVLSAKHRPCERGPMAYPATKATLVLFVDSERSIVSTDNAEMKITTTPILQDLFCR